LARCNIIPKILRPTLSESTQLKLSNVIQIPSELGLEKSILILIEKYEKLIEVQKK